MKKINQEEFIDLCNKNLSSKEICKILNISRNTFTKYKKIFNLFIKFNPEDILNQKFEKLLVISYFSKPYRKGQNIFYRCKCDCGKIKDVLRASLMRGRVKSCGCLIKDIKYFKKFPKKWKGYEGISKSYYSSIKRNARIRNLEFSVSIEYLWELFLKQNRKCALSGIELYPPEKFTDTKSYNASIDRIDSKKGYIEGNLQWVLKEINVMKMNMSDEKFIDLCNKISDFNKKKQND